MPDRSTAASSASAKAARPRPQDRPVPSAARPSRAAWSARRRRRHLGGRPPHLALGQLGVRAVGHDHDHRVGATAQGVGRGRQRPRQVGAGVDRGHAVEGLAQERGVGGEPRQRRGLGVDPHDHRAIAAAHAVDQRQRALLGAVEAGQARPLGVAVDRPHRGRGVEQDDDVAGPVVGGAQGRRRHRDDDQPDDRQGEEQRQEAPELLPQRVGVALLEDPLPQAGERHLEAAAPHLEQVGDDHQDRGGQGHHRHGPGGERGQPGHRRNPPARKMRSTSSSKGTPVWVRKNGTARAVQKLSSSLQ
jgi:hypothetical protein